MFKFPKLALSKCILFYLVRCCGLVIDDKTMTNTPNSQHDFLLID